jgi:hypothetical protein
MKFFSLVRKKNGSISPFMGRGRTSNRSSATGDTRQAVSGSPGARGLR